MDADVDTTADGSGDSDPGDPTLVPNCGDGVLDPEEECDDHNRLNGDGCDWVCRLGDGPPTPEPAPDTPRYEPAGPEVASEGSAWRGLGIPLVWNGSRLAAATYEPTPYDRPEEADTHIRFFEATAEGVIGGNDWNDPVASAFGTEGGGIWLDLVWTGDGYGLFYTSPADEPWTGLTDLWFLRLDETGKPIGVAVLVAEANPIFQVDADVYHEGFIVAWLEHNGGEARCGRGQHWPLSSLLVKLVHFDGSSDGLPEPIVVREDVAAYPTVSAGDDGFGLTMLVNQTETDPSCSVQFVRASSDLTDFTSSGTLANAMRAEVAYDGEEYVVAFAHWASNEDYPPGELCVARYTASGVISSAPVCNGPFTDHDLDCWLGNVSLAVGDDGLAVLLTTQFRIIAGGEATYPRLFFFRTDLAGRQVASPVEIDRSQMLFDASIVWTGDGFTSLHARSDADAESSTSTLVFNRFAREE